MNSMFRSLWVFLAMALAAAIAIGLLIFSLQTAKQATPKSSASPTAEKSPPSEDPKLQGLVPKPAKAAPASAVKTKVDPNTPPQYLAPIMQGYTPVEILADGTQIYEDIPYQVRQPDGTMKEFKCQMKFRPIPALPIFHGDLDEGPKKQ